MELAFYGAIIIIGQAGVIYSSIKLYQLWKQSDKEENNS